MGGGSNPEPWLDCHDPAEGHTALHETAVMRPLVNAPHLLPRPMSVHRLATRIALTSLLLVAVATTGSGVAVATTGSGHDVSRDTTASLDDIQNLLEQIDDFLETVADLLRTIRTITGGGG